MHFQSALAVQTFHIRDDIQCMEVVDNLRIPNRCRVEGNTKVQIPESVIPGGLIFLPRDYNSRRV
jgi:hypothetical protein